MLSRLARLRIRITGMISMHRSDIPDMFVVGNNRQKIVRVLYSI